MLSRRNFLKGTGTAILAQLLAGCSDTEAALRVLFLQGSIPPQTIGQFRRQLTANPSISFKIEPQLKDVFDRLKTWQQQAKDKPVSKSWLPFINQPSTPVNLVTLGDAWLATAISEKLIQPLSLEELKGWQQLPSRWQQLVRRNAKGESDGQGQIWGAPYRWGTVAIAYRRDKFESLGWTPTNWQDLWREELRDRLSLIDQPREVIGLTLKKLGYSYNTLDLAKVPDLKSELLKLQEQVKFYSSKHYLQPLVLGDTWLAVGWSSDILSLTARNRKIAAVVAQSGTSLWADLWVKPATFKDKETGDRASLAKEWIDFCWQLEGAKQIALFCDASSPILLNLKAEELPQDIRNNPLLSFKAAILNKSEFLAPLPPKILAEYQDLWREVRAKK